MKNAMYMLYIYSQSLTSSHYQRHEGLSSYLCLVIMNSDLNVYSQFCGHFEVEELRYLLTHGFSIFSSNGRHPRGNGGSRSSYG